ncbi:MAG TPA: EamA family transporter [Gemmatimonadales bacterium]|nr:EamA family transporter [Gemmatimonadales bacterium]
MTAPRGRLIAAFAAIYLLWGGTFLAIRYAVAEVPPLLTIAIRCAGGAALLFAWLWWRGERGRGTAAEWRTALVAGTFLFLGCHSLLAWAEQRVSSGEAALLMTAIPLWLVLLNAARERRVPPPAVVAGLALGMAGVALLTVGGSWTGTTADRLGLVASALFWAIGSLIARHGPRPDSALESTAMQLAAGGAVVLLASGAIGELGRWNVADTTPRAAFALLFLVVGGTVLGFGAYTWLLRVTTPAAVGTYAFVNPVVALGLAWVAGDGELSARVLAAAGIVVAAVALTWLPGAGASAGPPAQGRAGPPHPPPTAADGAPLPPARTRGSAAARAAGA